MSATAARSPAQFEASRQNGARSTGPATEAGKTRSALNSIRHGLCGRAFFLLADEDPAEFAEHERTWLTSWRPRDLYEHEAALAAIRAMWREIRADRLEVSVLTDLFGADRIADDGERDAAKDRAFKALAMLLRYKARIEREHRAAMADLTALRERRLRQPAVPPREPEKTVLPSEPEPARTAAALAAVPASPPLPDEPERSLNRHQRRALAAIERRAA